MPIDQVDTLTARADTTRFATATKDQFSAKIRDYSSDILSGKAGRLPIAPAN
jgi:hypothetical protein